jgi:hypothetical protein
MKLQSRTAGSAVVWNATDRKRSAPGKCHVLLVHLIALICWGVTSRSLVAQSTPNLLDVLRARTQAVETFHCQVEVTYCAGADRETYNRDRDILDEYLVAKGTITEAKLSERRALRSRPFSMTGAAYRYFARRDGHVRLDRYGTSLDDGLEAASRRSLVVWTGDRWQHFIPVQNDMGDRPPSMLVHRQEALTPHCEVARGAAAILNSVLKEELQL